MVCQAQRIDRLSVPRSKFTLGPGKVHFYEILTTFWAKAARHIRYNNPIEAFYQVRHVMLVNK